MQSRYRWHLQLVGFVAVVFTLFFMSLKYISTKLA